MRHPHVLQLIMDSLRYWVLEMHVDGFRFDLAATLARTLHDVDRLSAFFDVIQQDPVISQVKLIAEPWDVGEGGYQVGNFPPLWSEWNGRYRDSVRDFWRGQEQGARRVRRAAHRIVRPLRGDRAPAVGVDQLRHRARRLHARATSSSYNEKHNEANGEDGRDGTDDNRSWNSRCRRPDRRSRRSTRCARRQQRNFLATLFLSQGVPDAARRRRDRPHAGAATTTRTARTTRSRGSTGRTSTRSCSTFTSALSDIRRRSPVFRRRRWFQGRQIHGSGASDIAWFKPDGSRMTDEDWQAGFAKTIGVFLNGDTCRGRTTPGIRCAATRSS